jgi:hypothetical protein
MQSRQLTKGFVSMLAQLMPRHFKFADDFSAPQHLAKLEGCHDFQ